MSNDVARIIWEMAKADKSLDGLALKDMYHRKLEMDGDELRTKLKNLVPQQISSQSYKTELVLSEDKIIGAMARCNTKNIVGLVAQPSFSYKDSGNYIIVTNVESQFLIEYAIVPLDLKWRLINPGINNNIIVSWQHWKDLK